MDLSVLYFVGRKHGCGDFLGNYKKFNGGVKMNAGNYEYVSVHANDLDDMLLKLSEQKVRISTVSQSGNVYTIFYQRVEPETNNLEMNDLYDEEGGEILKAEAISKFAMCPFCGKIPSGKIKQNEFGKYKMTHYCFANIRGNMLACREITVTGCSEKEVVERWNNQYIRRK